MAVDQAIQLDDTSGQGSSYRFSGRLDTLSAWTGADVEPLLSEVETQAAAGRYAVGFVAYEAATALTPHLPCNPPQNGLPLAWFALYEQRHEISPTDVPLLAENGNLQFNQDDTEARYLSDVQEIRELIARGDCYQVNYTFKRTGRFTGDPQSLYRRIASGQQARYCAYLDTGRQTIMSASPELFFSLDGNRIVTRPMKGTIVRGQHRQEDAERAEALRNDPKERAENLMIVDLLRNDLGMIAEHGSVRVDSLFEVESYPTLHQLTSSISARLRPDIGLVQIFRALFPCGSITGAPKRRAMEVIADLEGEPRGVYCGAIGMVEPGRKAIFSVAIRTLVCDREQGRVTMGVGSGITWDSDPVSEFSECRTKGLFATASLPKWSLIESLRSENGACPMLQRHLKRMEWSAGRSAIPFDCARAETVLREHAAAHQGLRKVRLLLAPDGSMTAGSEPIMNDISPVKVMLSGHPVDSDDPLLYLKTTDRSRYDQARAEHPEADEVLLVNDRGELTEGTYHNLVLKLHGRLVTPPLSSGLLPGIMRESLLEQGVISEELLYPENLLEAEELWLVNAVRGWRKAGMVPKTKSLLSQPVRKFSE